MFSFNNSIKVSVNPSNLVAPVRVNDKLLNIKNKSPKQKVSTLDHEEYNYRSDETINSFYKSIDRSQKKYKSQYIYEEDDAFEEKSVISSLLPKIFYRKYGYKSYNSEL